MYPRKRSRKRWLVAAALALALSAAGVTIGLASTPGDNGAADSESDASEGTDSDQPLAGSDRDTAAAAALEYVGGGTVTEVETGDDGATYGVEIRRDDGSQVEVELDAAFAVIGTEEDDD